MNTITLQENIELAKVQQKVDDLENLIVYARKYKADNRDMLEYDLKRAKERLETLKGK